MTRDEHDRQKEAEAQQWLSAMIMVNGLMTLANLGLVLLIPFLWSAALMVVCLLALLLLFFAARADTPVHLMRALYGCVSAALMLLVDYIALAEAVDVDTYPHEDELEERVESDSFDRSLVQASMVVRGSRSDSAPVTTVGPTMGLVAAGRATSHGFCTHSPELRVASSLQLDLLLLVGALCLGNACFLLMRVRYTAESDSMSPWIVPFLRRSGTVSGEFSPGTPFTPPPASSKMMVVPSLLEDRSDTGTDTVDSTRVPKRGGGRLFWKSLKPMV